MSKPCLNDLCAGREGFKKFRLKLNETECTCWAADASDAMRDARTILGVSDVAHPECEAVAADWEFPEAADDVAEAVEAEADPKRKKK